jgi:hypothetical protein
VITIDAPNYRIRYSDDEIPTDRNEFLWWCKKTLWDNVKNARLYKSYDEALHKGQDAARVAEGYLQRRMEIKTRIDEITRQHNVGVCTLPQGDCPSCQEYYKLQQELSEMQ